MEPKEKAKELIEKYCQVLFGDEQIVNITNPRKCAIIAVDEILNLPVAFLDKNLIGGIFEEEESTYEFWEQVKEEINNL